MARPKGLPKTGGRRRGTPNKTSQALLDKLDALGCDPIEGLAKIALDPTITAELKVRCFLELAQYVYPKRKAVDVSTSEDRNIEVSITHVGGSPISKHQAT